MTKPILPLVLCACLAGLLLAISITAAKAGNTGDETAKQPIYCTEQYAPVCGRLGGKSKTYSNACFAKAAGAKDITPGPCSGSTPPPPQ